MSSAKFDVIVIGAGIEGTCTAFHLAKQGQRTLLLEQFDLPHSNGSSHGESRVTRTAYPEPFFTSMMTEAHELWDEIEKLGETQLVIKTGLLVSACDPCPAFDDTMKNMEKFSNANLEILDSEERQKRFPMIRYPDDYRSFIDKTGGIILAAKTMETVRNLYKKFGGNVVTNCKVTTIEPGENIVTLHTSKQVYQAASVVICAGLWTNKVLNQLDLNLPLQPTKVKVCYWKEKIPGSHSIKNGFSTFIDYNSCDHDIYGLPSPNDSGEIKICIHYGMPFDPDSSATDEKFESFDEDLKKLKDFVQKRFPGLVPEPNVTETCIYTVSPDEIFVLDSHPKYKNIIIGAGFSGTGFKFGPLVGKILCKMSMGEKLSYDMSPFSISRF